jgi:DNA adenine methylase
MKYMGGKSRIAKQIAATILASTNERSYYFEPFVGAGSVAAQMVPHFEHSYLSDASPDLIALWTALQQGWEPPEVVTEEMYQHYRNAPVSAMRGFVGYGCSFGGKWFGGYARNDPRPGRSSSAINAGRLLGERMRAVSGASFHNLDYRDLFIPNGSVVYCDPPYAGTTGYGRTGAFDSDEFWKWATALSRYATVYVSEYSAPEGWRSVWSATPRVTMRVDDNKARATEHLWSLSLTTQS